MAKNAKTLVMKIDAILARRQQGTLDDDSATGAIMVEVLELAVSDRARLRYMLDTLRELV